MCVKLEQGKEAGDDYYKIAHKLYSLKMTTLILTSSTI